MYAFIDDTCFSLSNLFNSVWQPLGPSTSPQMTQSQLYQIEILIPPLQLRKLRHWEVICPRLCSKWMMKLKLESHWCGFKTHVLNLSVLALSPCLSISISLLGRFSGCSLVVTKKWTVRDGLGIFCLFNVLWFCLANKVTALLTSWSLEFFPSTILWYILIWILCITESIIWLLDYTCR